MRPILRTAGLVIWVFLAARVTALAQAPVGEVFADDASVRGSVLYAGSGTQVLSGSQVAAGARPAVLKLVRGGEIRICPNTSVGVAASPNGRNLLFSLNQGDVEFHFDVRSDGDALQTPDFRVQFIGPAHFDLSMCTDKHGGLALRGNNNRAAVIVSEMMGDGVYQVSAGSSLDFQNGTVANPRPGNSFCGCPETPLDTPPQVILTEKPVPPPLPPTPTPEPPHIAEQSAASPQPALPLETHIQVDAPFVYQGEELQPEVAYTLARIQTVATMQEAASLQPVVTMPAKGEPADSNGQQAPEKKKGGFFRKIGSFFGKIFKG